jgi:hypothetical protein
MPWGYLSASAVFHHLERCTQTVAPQRVFVRFLDSDPGEGWVLPVHNGCRPDSDHRAFALVVCDADGRLFPDQSSPATTL